MVGMHHKHGALEPCESLAGRKSMVQTSSTVQSPLRIQNEQIVADQIDAEVVPDIVLQSLTDLPLLVFRELVVSSIAQDSPHRDRCQA